MCLGLFQANHLYQYSGACWVNADYCQQEYGNISNITESPNTCNVYYLEGSTSIWQLYFDYVLLKPIPVRLSDEFQRDGQ